jgi:Amt family ammonium transporter
MKKLYTLILLMCFAHLSGFTALAQNPPPSTPPAPTTAPAPATPPAPEAAAPATPPPPILSPADQAALNADVLAYFNDAAPAGPLKGIPGPGHNAWMIVATAFVLFMTLPGLALFYGGLVRKKNVLSVVAQCFGIAGMVTILWWVCGFSLAFAPEGSPFIGGTGWMFFKDIGSATGNGYYWISDNVWAMFQLTFAIITPALIVGAIAERMKFAAVMAFILLWMFAVYFPFAHMVWGSNGWMDGALNSANATIKALDFAGGTVVHMTSGWSALVLCLLLGKRRNYGKEPMQPHSMVMCAIGTGMLWVGWYGFNAGSALGADVIAANAFTTTTLAAATAGFVWAMLEWVLKGKPSVLGFCSGVVAGLVVITPACGFVNTNSAMIIGLLAGSIPFAACAYLKAALGYDDALDTFGVHGIGGTLGALLTGVFADEKVNPAVTAVKEGLFMSQVKAVCVTAAWSVAASLVIGLIVKAVIGLRPTEEDEETGLDLVEHGEEGYHA